jgi:iron complex transport system permease protein
MELPKGGMISPMRKRTIVLLCLLPFCVMFISLFFGRYSVSAADVLQSLLKLCRVQSAHVSIESLTVVTQLRMPRIIASVFVGAALAASGAAFQGVFRNPLANSSLLGVSSGAGFGAALAIILFPTQWPTYLFAFAFGTLAVVLSYWIARIYKTVPTIMLVLGGMIVSSIFSALISLLKYVADTERQLPAIVYWMMGSLSSVGYKNLWALLPITCGLILLIICSWRINVLSMGDKEAQTMGVNVKLSKALIVSGATLATAGAVCLSGVIGWVGLVIPHIGRMLTGNDNRKLLPVSMAIGAVFMTIIDTVSRIIVESEIPLGILTALIGAPFFIFLLKKTKGGGWH